MASNVLEFVIQVKEIGTEAVKRLREDVDSLKGSASSASGKTSKLSKGISQLGSSADKASGKAKELSKGLSQTGKNAKKAETGISGLNKNIGYLKEAIGAIGIFELAKKFVNVSSSFETFKTQLTTILGSSKQAEQSFAWIKNFAKSTPFEISTITEAFVRLNSYGINPTNGTLRILGDTASSMGKGLMESVEALADAMTGQFERLKEFGIQTRATAKQVTFYWVENGKQMQKTVQNSGAAIQKALLGLFGKRFAGGMKNQMKTFRGIISNFFDNLTNAINDFMQHSGIFEGVKRIFSSLNNELSGAFNSQQFEKASRNIGKAVKDIVSTFKQLIQIIRPILEVFSKLAVAFGPDVLKTIVYLKTLSWVLGIISGTGKLAATSILRIRTAALVAKMPVLDLAASFETLGSSITAIGAAIMIGWDIGTWLRRFGFFRWLGMEIIGILIRIKYYAIAAVKALTFNFHGAKEALIEMNRQLAINRQAYEDGEAHINKKVKQTVTSTKAVGQAQRQVNKEQETTNNLVKQGLNIENQLKEAVKKQCELKEKLKAIDTDRVSFVQKTENDIADAQRSNLSGYLKQASMYREAWGDIDRTQKAVNAGQYEQAQLLLSRARKLFQSIKAPIIPTEGIKQGLSEVQKLYQQLAGKNAFKLLSEAEKEREQGNYEQAKSYLKQAEKLFNELAGSKNELVSKKGIANLELVKKEYEEIAKVQKESVQKNIDETQKKIEKLSTALSDITAKYEKIANKKVKISFESNINELIDYWDSLKDRTVTLTVKKQEVETHKSGGIVGVVPGGWGGGDKVHALLEPGEFVIKKEAVSKFGAGFLGAINSLRLPKLPAPATSLVKGVYKKFVINIGGAEIEGFSTKEALAAFERKLKRQRLRLA